jgi:hypothetical protein
MLKIWFLVLRKHFSKQEKHIYDWYEDEKIVRKYILVLRKQI